MRVSQPFVVSLPAVILIFAAGSPAWAARLLTATVELDGQVVLETTYQDDGYPHRERVWRYIGKEPLWAAVSKVSGSPTAPLRAKLQGDLVIRIKHTNAPIIEAKASELTLVRKHPSSDQWFLLGEDVERVAQANGISKPSLLALSEGERWRAVFWGGGALLVVTLILVVWWVRMLRRGWNAPGPAQAGQEAEPGDAPDWRGM